MKIKTKIALTMVTLSIMCCLVYAESTKADTYSYVYPVYPPDYGSPTWTMIVKLNGEEIGSASKISFESTTVNYHQDTLWLDTGDVVTAEFYDPANNLITTQNVATGAGYLNDATWTAHFNLFAEAVTIDDGATYTLSWTGYTSGTYVSGVSFTTYYQLTVTGGDSSTTGYNNGVFYQSGTSTTSTTNYVYGASGSQRSNVYRWQLDGGSWTNIARSNTGTISTTSITMNTAHTVNWGSVTQYPLSYTGGNSVSYGGTASQTSDNWYDSGSQPTVNSNGIWSRSGGSGTRVASWNINSGSSTNVATTGTVTVPLTMDGEKTVNFVPATQKQLTYTGGNGVTFSSPTITGDTGWYDSTATASISSNWIWSVGSDTRTALQNCQLDGTNQNPARQNTGTYTLSGISMSATHAVTFVSATQNKLTVTGGNSITYGTASPTSDNWYDSTQSTTISTNWIWGESGGARTTLYNWQLDGPSQNPARQYSGTLTTQSISMNTYHTVTFLSIPQYYFTVSTSHSTPTSSASKWYDSGTIVYAGLTSGIDGNNVFDHWNNDASGTNYAQSNSITMNAPKTALAVWETLTYHYITSNSSADGTIAPSGLVQVVQGNDQQFNMTASEGYERGNVYIDYVLTDIGSSTTFTFYNVNSNHSIYVEFQQAYTENETYVPPENATVYIGGFSAPPVVLPNNEFVISAVANDENGINSLNNVTINLSQGITLTWNNLDEFNATDLSGIVVFVSGTSTILNETAVRLSWTISLQPFTETGVFNVIAAEVTNLLDQTNTASQNDLFTLIGASTGGNGGGSGGGSHTVIINNPSATPAPFTPQAPEAILGVVLIAVILAIVVIIGIARSSTAKQWAKRNGAATPL